MLEKYLFLQNIWLSIFNTIVAIGIRLGSFPSFFQRKHKARRIAHVIGNGPSLKTDMDRVLRYVGNEDCEFVCVNMFADSEMYEVFRPNIYVLSDDIFFKDNPPARCINTLANISSRTKWSLSLVVPYSKRHALVLRQFDEHPNIKVRTMGIAPVVGGTISYNAFLFWVGIATPLFQNVMIQAIFYSLKCGSREIHIWGADHSWMQERTVRADNKMYMKCKHFDGEDELVVVNDTVHNDLLCFARCLRIYHELANYAKLLHARIYNNSSYSWIDAFDRELE